MSVVVEGNRAVYLGAQAWLVDDTRELAWAEKHVVNNRSLKYVLGRYVEADTPNENGHIFDLKELGEAQRSIPNSPLNLLHRPHYIVGNFVASELVYPTAAHASSQEPLNPWVEALAAFYRYYYPDEFAEVEKAHADGALFFSMECVPETVSCAGVCGASFAYQGRQSDTYCDHLNQPAAKKRLGKPHFTGGALIMPPTQPGWKRADITQVSALMAAHASEAEEAYRQVSSDTSHLDAKRWEGMVGQLMTYAYREMEGEEARDFSTDQRKSLAKSGAALPDGSYPIVTAGDLANAIKAFGRSNPGDRAKVKAHIIKRARALKRTDLIPDGWNSS